MKYQKGHKQHVGHPQGDTEQRVNLFLVQHLHPGESHSPLGVYLCCLGEDKTPPGRDTSLQAMRTVALHPIAFARMPVVANCIKLGAIILQYGLLPADY